MCFRVCLQFIALKTENRHYANFVITGSIEGRYNGKLPNVTNDKVSILTNLSFSWLPLKTAVVRSQHHLDAIVVWTQQVGCVEGTVTVA